MADLLTDDQVRGVLLVINGGRVDLRRSPKRKARPLRLERTCTDCQQNLPLQAFVYIRSTNNGYYGRCRVCRAGRARERYQADPAEERYTYCWHSKRNPHSGRPIGPRQLAGGNCPAFVPEVEP